MTRWNKFSSKALILLNHSANDTSMNRMAKNERQQWNGEWAEFYYPLLDRQTIYERQLS